MIKIFIFIFFVSYKSVHGCSEKYCKICTNHTLCKYEVSGPSSSCIGYDKNALLTEENIKDLIERVNHRRNFIAEGHSNFFPGAANMKKITWSQELATMAQRWVDQCDRTFRPDKEDQCRDLESVKVGQSIATIMGQSSGINVKSFVEIWFMQSLDYNGSVTYYNRSRDFKTNYFSQLIWANTEKIGCGKAKFYVNSFKVTPVERLVCNFAPKGNNHKKPIYIIGYAATQCGDDMQPDKIYLGLCVPKETLTSTTPLATSLLRIRNLFNNSAKQEIDPVYHDLNQMENESRDCMQSNKKTIYTIVPDAVKRSPIDSRNFETEKGHSRVYNNHNHKIDFDSNHPETLFKDFRKYDYTTTLFNYKTEQDYSKHNINKQCTRNKGSEVIIKSSTIECLPCNVKSKKCTRAQKKCQDTQQRCDLHNFETTTTVYSDKLCACKYQTPCPTTSPCVPKTNCDCNSICPMKRCRNMLRTLSVDSENVEKRNDFLYDDIYSDITFKKEGREYPLFNEDTRLTPLGLKIVTNQRSHRKKAFNPDYSEMKRSVTEDDDNFKPFWQMDDYINKKQPRLKSLRYTTLRNRKNKMSKRNKNVATPVIKTEHITVKLSSEQQSNNKRITEKYLSFDELMHLRKYNTGNLGGRRSNENAKSTNSEDKKVTQDSGTSKTESSTTEYTANTPFIRMKHCTRKLTCTWTAASLTDSEGKIIPGGAGGGAGHLGSRTSPGYVEGCTRTSTCTRDYMNRNKMPSITIETTTPEFDTGDDEDYCERRSLDRRHSNNNLTIEFKAPLNQSSLFSNTENRHFNKRICYKNVRTKRNEMIDLKPDKIFLGYENDIREKKEYIQGYNNDNNNIFSYRDLYYYILKQIVGTRNSCSTNCLCNNIDKIIDNNLLILLSMVIIL